ncbi:MAG: sigma-70 family RNA polymerase sigma factor [Kiritimatiellia bacterium]|jgi:RNA polymerase sigma-70 factor (ECF subfamily)|nr:sigma-70 family RNA polymerase sigma factor [Kiritimatiellia bacterium]
MCGLESEGQTEARLIERFQKGDQEAFDAIFALYRRRLLAYVRVLVHDRGLAEDIVQDTFVRLARHIAGIKPSRGVSSWIFRVAKNRAIDVIRHRKFETPTEDAILERSVNAGGGGTAMLPSDAMIGKERRAEVVSALDSLPESERNVLVLRFYGDLTFKEISGVVERPIGTVLWQAHRGIRRLRKLLDRR